MSNPAQPCFVWQIYDYSLETYSAFFGVQKACEPIHILMTQDDFELIVVNNSPKPLDGMKFRVQIYNLDGSKKLDQIAPISISLPATKSSYLGTLKFPDGVSPVHFVKIALLDAQDKVVSDNFYWHETKQDDFTAMDSIPDANLDSRIVRHDENGKCLLDVTLTNSTSNVAVMAHLQLRNGKTNQRVLPVYYSDNYVSLLPQESKTITVEADARDLAGDQPLVVVDGWNITTKDQTFPENGGVRIATNTAAHVDRPNAK
jgi:hypothetical protein